jgi:hypothetical protein
MARIRSLHPEFFESDDTATLSPMAALTYAGLWVVADDEGRGRASLGFLHRRLHAGRPGVTENDTGKALKELADQKLIRFYEGDGGAPLFFIPSFKRHQSPKYPSKSKFPEPPGEFPQSSPSLPPGLGKSSPNPPLGEERSREESGGEEGKAPEEPPARPERQSHGTSQEATIVSRWNDQRDRFKISIDAGVQQVTATVAAGVPLDVIDTAFWDPRLCRGKKIWEVLDALKARHGKSLKDQNFKQERDSHGPRKLT